MKPVQNLSAEVVGTAVCCDVTAHAAVRVTQQELQTLRPQVGALLGRPLPTTFLKHADDQTVVTLAAVGRAIQRFGLASTDFQAWGVVAAPRFLGRVTMAGALERFFAEGAWGVSPHMIPHRSLHSVSGTISQALKIHGPNFGVGGGPGCASECLLAAAAVVQREYLPGVWLVLSGCNPEPEVGGADSKMTTHGQCGAVALALRAAQRDWGGMKLRVKPVMPAQATTPALSLERLLDALADDAPATAAAWRLDCGGCVELEQIGIGAAVAVHRLAG